MAFHSAETPLRLTEGPAFEERWGPAERVMLPGIYRCACGFEAPVTGGDRVPGREHRHQPSQGAAVWRLIIAAEAPAVVAMPARARLAEPARSTSVDLV